MQLKVEEAPEFDDVHVNFGDFHTEIAWFKVLGKFIKDSGAPHFLNESGIIQNGSINSFLSGKNYKRAKTIHEELALVLEILHIQWLLSKRDATAEDRVDIDQIKCEMSSLGSLDDVPDYTSAFLKDYSQFVEKTLCGLHGKTAQYWLMYVNMMHLYHEFVRSIRVGDIHLYMSCLPKMSAFFFVFNHLNYCRYLLQHYSNLKNLRNTHPEVWNEYKNGGFSIRRTSKPFSGLPIDLTLEQTINAESASRSYGVISMTRSIYGRQRWAVTDYIRKNNLRRLREDLHISKKDIISTHLTKGRIKKMSNNISSLLETITDGMNPFSDDVPKDHLFNIASGEALNEVSIKFLLSYKKNGKDLQTKFINECLESPERFGDKISRQTLHTFSTLPKKNGPVENVTAINRDIFGSSLYLALKNEISIETIMEFPMARNPPALAHVDGGLKATQKSKLLHEIESKFDSAPPKKIDVVVFDGFFFLRLTTQIPPTFRQLARKLLINLCRTKAGVIHIVFDKYLDISIKNIERGLRKAVNVPFRISGPGQITPGNWQLALKNSYFKIELVRFLCDYWSEDHLHEIIGTKHIYMNCNDLCFHFQVCYETVLKTEERRLHNAHEEAENRMVFHLASLWPADDASFMNVVVRTCDTDVLIIILGCKDMLDPRLQIWLEVGLMSYNTLRYIDVNQAYRTLGPNVRLALLAFHAFTGCDYLAAFCRKGKVRPFRLLLSSPDVVQVFANMCCIISDHPAISDDDFITLQNFVCKLYGQPNVFSVNKARANCFFKKFKPKKRINCLDVPTILTAL